MFLGPVVEPDCSYSRTLTRTAIKALGFDRLPTFAHIAMDGTLEGKSEGWQPNGVAGHRRQPVQGDELDSPVVERDGDPAPF